jgi:hypothetical protein
MTTRIFNNTEEFTEYLITKAMTCKLPTDEKYVEIFDGSNYNKIDEIMTLSEMIEKTSQKIDDNSENALDLYDKLNNMEKYNEGKLEDDESYIWEDTIQEATWDMTYDIFLFCPLLHCYNAYDLFLSELIPFYQSQIL